MIRDSLTYRRRAAEALLCSALTVFALALWLSASSTVGAPGAVAVTCLLCAQGGALLWRRTHPWPVMSALIVSYLACEFLDPASEGALTMAFAAYAVARYTAAPASLISPALLGGAVLLPALLRPRQDAAGLGATYADVFVVGLIAAGIWLLGATLRRLHTDAVHLRDLARRLRLEQQARARDAVVAERARIARDLHDMVAHHVSAIAMQARATTTLLPRDAGPAAEGMAAIGSTADTALEQMRGILRLLSDERAPDGGCAVTSVAAPPEPALVSLSELVSRARAAGCRVSVQVDEPVRVIPPAVQLSAYRIVQEGITNVLKHAGPTEVRIDLRRDAGTLTVTIENGPPAPGHRPIPGSGLGLVGLRERAALYGGTLTAGPYGHGWRTTAMLKLGKP